MTLSNTQSQGKIPWFIEDPTNAASKEEGLNLKYGSYDYSSDARVLYENKLVKYLKQLSKGNTTGYAVVVGSNDGREAKYLTSHQQTFIVDLAKDALSKADKNLIPIFSDAERLPFIDAYFNTYVALRALYSQHTNLDMALGEASRVLKKGGTFIASVPNGYLINGIIESGIYDYKSRSIDKEAPFIFAKQTADWLGDHNFKNIVVLRVGAEIIISAIKS